MPWSEWVAIARYSPHSLTRRQHIMQFRIRTFFLRISLSLSLSFSLSFRLSLSLSSFVFSMNFRCVLFFFWYKYEILCAKCGMRRMLLTLAHRYRSTVYHKHRYTQIKRQHNCLSLYCLLPTSTSYSMSPPSKSSLLSLSLPLGDSN